MNRFLSLARPVFAFVAGLFVSAALAIEPSTLTSGDTDTVHGDWPFKPPTTPQVPTVADASRVQNQIDAFIIARLQAQGLQLSRPADRLSLLRRLTFDLTGLPPTPDEIKAFQNDASSQAYARVVERLLASPQYGARWAQHWLDVVRYAETDGFKSDAFRPSAYRYRDYVIRSFNLDRPYDEFVRQQLAGDELDPSDAEALIATGLNRLYADEDNAANLFQRRQEILDDITETTGLAFLGLTMGCAQCHDHKFDDILQEDYFRLQAFFAPIVERDDIPYADAGRKQAYDIQLAQWKEATKDIQAEIDQLLDDKRKAAEEHMLSKFEPAIIECYRTPASERTPYQEQIARIAGKQVRRAIVESKLVGKLSKADKATYAELKEQRAEFDHLKPTPLPTLMAVTDLGERTPPTYILDGGNWRNPMDEVDPGFPLFLDTREPSIADSHSQSSGRRASLANWLTDGSHPLTARVIVNRLWHHHFGRGIVATPNDFGVQGQPPTHPKLLDWLATELVRKDWSLKAVHRLIVTSATYQQSALVDDGDPVHALARERDPDNQLWWHAERRRLEGEAIRDAMLTASGRLNRRLYGESARPELPEGASKRYAWEPDPKIEDRRRRSVFVFAKRNMRFPIFDSFDFPDMHQSCGMRTRSTTPPQALLMLNSEDTLGLAKEWAAELESYYGDDTRALVHHVYQSAIGRGATDDELVSACQFIETQQLSASSGVADFCHVLFNCNEFIYID